jgi:MOSC domain-containing protein YiiM
MVTGELLAICTGTPTDYGTEGAEDPFDRPWRTSFFKYPVSGSRWLSFTNVAGDAQADTAAHGGAEKAVLAYSADHYPDWNAEVPDIEFGPGAFAENLTIAGISEETVCLGDTWQIGEAILQVNQPRIPCWKISWRWRVSDLTLKVQQSRRTGWYHRVLQEGEIEAGMHVTLLERPNPEWTIDRCNQVLHVHKYDLELAAGLASLPELAEVWRDRMKKRTQTDAKREPVAGEES